MDATPVIKVAFASAPLADPAYTDVSSYLRALSVVRGRNFEYDRIEAGTLGVTLDNRDSRFNPDNTAGPYYPNVKPTRRTQLEFAWGGVTYHVFEGFTEGWPQAFPDGGFDATIQQRASDWFLPLNAMKFAGAQTTLAADVTTAPDAGTSGAITVASTALPLPQAFPFTIQVGASPDIEKMEVTARPASGQWTVTRGHEDTLPRTHLSGAAVRSEAVRFAEEQSGTRINNVLTMAGISGADRSIDPGRTLIAASDDLAGTSFLEHLLLIAQAENGRFFAAKDGTLTFRDRHAIFASEPVARGTFGDQPGDLIYSVNLETLIQDESKLYNVIRITIADGTIVESRDQTSIDEHFERTLDLNWPLASANEAKDAADYMLSRLKDATTRIPSVTLQPARDPNVLWPVVLGMEIGHRYLFRLTPRGGGTTIQKPVIVDGIQHDAAPQDWRSTLRLTLADTTTYWRLDTSGQSELDDTTILAY